MQLTVKTLQQKAFKVEAEPSILVKDFKALIEEAGKSDHGGVYKAEAQKLIYQGKILEDEKKIEEYQITEKGFIVLMVTKPKVVPKPVEPKPEPTPAAPAAAASTESSTPAESTSSTDATTTPSQPVATEAAAPVNPHVANLMAMGFPESQVKQALSAAFNNPERAVEYLMNGIPEELLAQMTTTPEAAAASAGTTADASAAPTVTAPSRSVGSTLEQIRNEPQFQQIRTLIRNNPQLLSQFIQQLQIENPEAFAAISANQQEFINMINEPGEAQPAGDDSAEAAAPATPGDGPRVRQTEDGRVMLEITAEDRASIERLKELGFPEQAVLQAFFACDKNENDAANFLLSGDFD
ncbi:unnamed protein product [Oikopleura dioica]|uniref:UV excision repair protein RAD23 n=1 Tax=Oikopleura dioica TaxID=34765 RepID=E4WPU2_OIKDI|nr:unnamed protein product [Oikopleura dioica]